MTMTKDDFFDLPEHERYRALKDAARAVNAALNLFGRETVDELCLVAASDERALNSYLLNITTVSEPDFPADFIDEAMPAVEAFRTLATYYREASA